MKFKNFKKKTKKGGKSKSYNKTNIYDEEELAREKKKGIKKENKEMSENCPLTINGVSELQVSAKTGNFPSNGTRRSGNAIFKP